MARRRRRAALLPLLLRGAPAGDVAAQSAHPGTAPPHAVHIMPGAGLDRTPISLPTVINRLPHDRTCYTQGISWDPDQGVFYESCGQYGESSVRVVNSAGGLLSKRALPDSEFGEGLAFVDDKIFQFTWKSGHGYVYTSQIDDVPLTPVREWRYKGQGWGMTGAPYPPDPSRTVLAVSNGTNKISFYDPGTLEVLPHVVEVYERYPAYDVEVSELNELEYIRGELWANVWYSNRIAVIDLTTGLVRWWLDCGALAEEAKELHRPSDVLNGVAYDAASDRTWITGKHYPTMWEVRYDVVPTGGPTPAPPSVYPSSAPTAGPTPQPPPSAAPAAAAPSAAPRGALAGTGAVSVGGGVLAPGGSAQFASGVAVGVTMTLMLVVFGAMMWRFYGPGAHRGYAPAAADPPPAAARPPPPAAAARRAAPSGGGGTELGRQGGNQSSAGSPGGGCAEVV